MKLIQYIDDSYYARVAILFDDNTYAVTSVISGNRSKDDILKDAYILLRNVERVRFEGKASDFEDLTLPAPKEKTMDIDFYNLTGKVYDQYGEVMDKEISFEVQGTDKARIENNKIIEEEVTEETSYFIVAKCGELVQKEKRFIYPPVKEEPRENLEDHALLKARVEELEKAHTTQGDWTPEKTPALFKIFEVKKDAAGNEVVAEFKHPTGGHDSYKKGDKVQFKGAIYESLIDNNAYSPEEYTQGWKKISA